MRIIKNFLSCVFIIVLLLGGCKCKDDEVPTRLLSQESKDYCLFLPGSWWVYQNEQTLEYDTLKITGVQNALIFSKNTNDNIERNTIAFEQKELFVANKSSLERGTIESYYGFNFNGGVGYEIYFDRPTYRIDSISISTTLKLVKYYDTIQFNRVAYKSVKQFQSLINFEYKYIYWANHIGIIQLEKPNGDIWNLINYSVQQ